MSTGVSIQTTVTGDSGDNVFFGSYQMGSYIDGKEGRDTIIYSSQRDFLMTTIDPTYFRITRIESGYYDLIRNIEILNFLDGTLYLSDSGYVRPTFKGSNGTDEFLDIPPGSNVDGGLGVDYIIYGHSADYIFDNIGNQKYQITNKINNSVDVVQNVEIFGFLDRVIFITSDGYESENVYKGGYRVGQTAAGNFYFHVADLNRDGRTDLIIGYTPAALDLNFFTIPFALIQGADGRFVEDHSFISGSRLAVHAASGGAQGDLNGDGHLDFIISSSGYDAAIPEGGVDYHPGDRSILLLSDASGKLFDSSDQLPFSRAFTMSISVGDLNKDSHADIFMANLPLPNPSTILTGNGKGDFSPIFLPKSILDTPQGASILADINRDGLADIVFGSAWYNPSRIYFQTAGGTFSDDAVLVLPDSIFSSVGAMAQDITVFDINYDGIPDILISLDAYDVSDHQAYIQILVQNVDGSFDDETQSRLIDFEYQRKPFSVTAFDVNLDGHKDIILKNFGMYDQNILLNDGVGRFNGAGHEAGFPRIPGWNLFPGLAGELYAMWVKGDGSYGIERFDGIDPKGTGPNGLETASIGAPGYNEGFYRNEYADVRNAIARGEFASGLDHYLAVGRAEGRFAFAPHTTVWGAETADRVILREGSERAYAGAGDDEIWGGTGSDYIDGGAGRDIAGFEGPFAFYETTSSTGGALTVRSLVGPGDTDTLISIERLQFSDGILAFDISGNAGQAYRLYQAAFARTPDTPGLKYQTNALDTALNLWQVAGNFIASPEFQSLYGSPATVSDAQFVTLLYNNVLGRNPEQAGYEYHMNNLAGGLSRAQLLTQFSESPENQRNVLPAIQDGIWMG